MNTSFKILKSFLLVMMTLTASFSEAHKGVDHHAAPVAAPTSPSAKEEDVFRKINDAYLTQVKPLFQRACMDCHSANTVYPWYYSLPGVKQLIDADIKDGRTHLDITRDFPFESHENPLEDLKAIHEEVAEGEMPPLGYKLFHASSRLNDQEIKIILDWAQSGIAELNQLKQKEK